MTERRLACVAIEQVDEGCIGDLVASLIAELGNDQIETCEAWLSSLCDRVAPLNQPDLFRLVDREALSRELLHAIEWTNPEFQILAFQLLAMLMPSNSEVGDAVVPYLSFEPEVEGVYQPMHLISLRMMAACALARQSEEYASAGFGAMIELGITAPEGDFGDFQVAFVIREWLTRNYPERLAAQAESLIASLGTDDNALMNDARMRMGILLGTVGVIVEAAPEFAHPTRSSSVNRRPVRRTSGPQHGVRCSHRHVR